MALDVKITRVSPAINGVVELGMVLFDLDRRSGTI